MGEAFHFNNCFVDVLANAFCLPLFSSLPFLLSSFKMTGDRAFSLGKELRGDTTVQAVLGRKNKGLTLILNSVQVHIQQDYCLMTIKSVPIGNILRE